MKKEKLLLIDGHSIINRAFYGVPDLTNAAGLHTNAIYGFLNIFFQMYTKEKPEYIITCFDLPQKTFRHEMYAAYKGTRKGMPDELHEQVPVLKDVLHSMGIQTAELAGFEADDLLGTYAKAAEQAGLSVLVLSGDRDLLQLASEDIRIIIPKTKMGGTEVETYYAADVKERYQVTPTEFVDVKALMGDASDNIPGIPGIGEKTATKLIAAYHSLENAYAHAEEVTPNKARQNLIEFIEQGRLSRALAQINVQVPVTMPFTDAKVEAEADFYNENSYALYKQLELKKLLERFTDMDKKAPTDFSYDTITAAQMEELLQSLGKDRTATGLFVDADACAAAVSYPNGEGILTKITEGELPDLLAFLTSGAPIYVFGFKRILHALHAYETLGALSYDAFSQVRDLEIMAYLEDPSKSSYSYDSIYKAQIGDILPSKEELLGKRSVKEALQEGKQEDVFRMAAYASKAAFLAAEPLQTRLRDMRMEALFTDMEMPLCVSLYNMESVGIRVEKDVLFAFSEELGQTIHTLEEEIYTQAQEEFNINSPKQLGVILFEKMKLPHGKKTKTGYSTSADVLEKLADEFPFVNLVLEYRKAAKLKSTYADGLTAYIASDGRIHGTFHQTITATGRISSAEPNLQNIPIRNELGQGIRKAFVAKEGYVFLDADYSQIELRLLAHLSGDENLIEAYKSDADIHKITASKVFRTPLNEVTKEQRSNAKAVNFGIVYGISSFGLSQGLSISRKEAGEYINQYFQTYPKVKEFLDRTVQQAKMDGYTTTMFARRRPIPELLSSNFMQRSFGERAAMNAPIQGTAADIIKIAMLRVEKALRIAGLDAKIVLQVHDELLIECAEKDVIKAKEILLYEMQHAAKTSVPLEVEIDQGNSWFEAH